MMHLQAPVKPDPTDLDQRLIDQPHHDHPLRRTVAVSAQDADSTRPSVSVSLLRPSPPHPASVAATQGAQAHHHPGDRAEECLQSGCLLRGHSRLEEVDTH